MKIDGFITTDQAREILKQNEIKPSEVKKLRQFIKTEVIVQFKDGRPSKTIKLN